MRVKSLLLVVLATGLTALGLVAALDATGATAAVGRLEAEVDVLLRVHAHLWLVWWLFVECLVSVRAYACSPSVCMFLSVRAYACFPRECAWVCVFPV